MSRDYKVYLEDICESITKIRKYTSGISFQAFKNDSRTFDATVRNLEIIGEAARKVPGDFRVKYPEIEWKKMAGLRDVLIHEYFSVDAEIIWDIINNKLPRLEKQLQAILSKK